MSLLIYQSKAGVNTHDEIAAEEKAGASGNNAASNCSNGRMACGQKNNELIEKGSDSEVSVLIQRIC